MVLMDFLRLSLFCSHLCSLTLYVKVFTISQHVNREFYKCRLLPETLVLAKLGLVRGRIGWLVGSLLIRTNKGLFGCLVNLSHTVIVPHYDTTYVLAVL